MTTTKLLEHGKLQKIGKDRVVVLPLKIWKELENRFEDLSARESKALKKKIAKARFVKKVYSAKQVKKILGI